MTEFISRNKHLWSALLVGLTTVLAVMLPRFLDPYSMEADFSNWYWMNRFRDPELFANDFTVESWLITITIGPITLLIDKSSPLYSLLFQLFSPLVSPVLLGKLLAFPLAAATIFYLYRLSERLTSPIAAMTITILFIQLNLILPSLVSIMGGFQRSFVLPLSLAFIYYWQEKRYRTACVVSFLAGGIYPPLFVIFIMAIVLELILFWRTQRHSLTLRQYAIYLGGLVVLGLLIMTLLWPFIEARVFPAMNNLQATALALSDDSGYGYYGRSRLFYIFPLVGRGGIADHGMTIFILLFLALFALGITVWQPHRWRDFPRVCKTLAASSFIGFALAWIGFALTDSFILYLPSRYTQSSILLILFIFVTVNAPAALQAAAHWITVNRPALFWLTTPVAGILTLLFFLLPEYEAGVLAFGRGASRWLLPVSAVLLLLLTFMISQRAERTQSETRSASQQISLYRANLGVGLLLLSGMLISWSLQLFTNYTYRWPTPASQELYAYVRTLPKDALLAGSTDPFVDSISMFGKRRVLLTEERLGPSTEAIVDTLVAYYNADPTELLAFCDKYEVTYLIVYARDFARMRENEKARYFYEPYHSMAAARIGTRDTFFLESLPDSLKSFQRDDWYLAPCTVALLAE